MIQASELRIGNWVMQRGKETIVDSLSRDMKDWDRTNHLRTRDCKPIPITEQWLLEFGFEWRDDIEQDKSLVLELSQRIKIVFYKGDPSCCSLYQDDKSIDLASKKISQIHQLQNLYFALTGKELIRNAN